MGMILDVKAVRLSGALRRMSEWSGPDALVLQVDQSLLAVNWPLAPNTSAPVVVGPPGAKVLAANVAVDDAWTIEPKSRQVVLARDGAMAFMDPSKKVPVRNIKVNGLKPGTFGAALDGDGKRVLLVVMRDVSMDFAEYSVVVANLATGFLSSPASLGANADLELLWDESSRAWVIGNTHTGSLWRWNGGSPAVKFEGPGAGPLQSATFASTSEGVVITALLGGTAGESSLVIGTLEPDGVEWSRTIAVSGGTVLLARRHPKQPMWACLAYEGAGQQIQIRDASGKILAAAAVRSPVLLNNLQWSVFSPTRLWGLGVRALAAVTLVESAQPDAIGLK